MSVPIHPTHLHLQMQLQTTTVEFQSEPQLAILRRDQLRVEIAKEKRRGRWCARVGQVIQIVVMIQAGSGLITGILHYAENKADCSYPIPLWLLINSSLSILLNLMMFISTCCQHLSSHPAEFHKQATRNFRLMGGVTVVCMIIWCFIGAKWAFDSNSDDCDSTTLRSIQTNVGLLLVILAFLLVISPLLYMYYRRHKRIQREREEIFKLGGQAEIQVRTTQVEIITNE